MFSKKLRALAFFLMALMVFYVLPVNCMQDVVSALSIDESENITDNESLDAETSIDEDAYVLGEDLSKREESAKHFRMSDGSYVAVQYAEPVHYLNENGEYTEYDNTLILSQNTSDGLIGNIQSGSLTAGSLTAINGFKANKSDVSVTLANSANQSTLTSIRKGEYSVSILPLSLNTSSRVVVNNTASKPDLGSKPTIEEASKLYNHTSSVKYVNLFGGADLEYILSGSKLKENIIVNETASSYVYSFTLNLTGLYATLNEDGSISLIGNNTDKVEFTIPAGYMFDDAGNYSEDVTYTLTSKPNGNYILTVTASSEWINSNDRVFPVTVDPTITVGARTTTEIHDTYAAQDDPTATPQGYYWMEAGADATNKKFRAYTKLAILPEIPPSSVIIEAKINLYQLNEGGYSGSADGIDIAVREVIEYWDVSTLCWEEQPVVSDTILDYIHLDSSTKGNIHSMDITSVAKKWYDGEENYGISLYPTTEYASENVGTLAKVRFATVNNPHGLYGEQPLYVIKYRDSKGIDSRWTYTSHTVGNGGTASICDFNGNLVFVHNDAVTLGNILPLEINHVYNAYLSNNEFDSSMKVGFGFKLSLQETVALSTINGENYYVVSDGDGTDCYFQETENGKYENEDNSDLVLTVLSDGYEITDGNNNYKYFDENGRLISIEDSLGNEKNIVYSNNCISYVSEKTTGGNEVILYHFSYYNGILYKIYNNSSLVEQVQYYYSTSPTGGELYTGAALQYIESTNVYLRKISHFKGTSVTFEYDNEGYLTTITDVGRSDEATPYSVQFDYEQGVYYKRVSNVSEKSGETAGQEYKISYDTRKTIFQSPGKDTEYETSDDIYTTCVFDVQGNTVTSYSHNYDKSIIYGVSSSTFDQNNRLMSAVSSGVQAQNMMPNSSFETTGNWTVICSDSCIGGIVSNAENAYIGEKYYSISATQSGQEAYIYSFVSINSTGKYTASAYVNTSTLSGGGAYIQVKYGNEVISTSHEISGRGWERIITTFNAENSGNYTIEIGFTNSLGTIFIDAVQLEKGAACSEYNIITNSQFDTSTSWTTSGGTILNNSTESISGTSAMSLNGVSSATVYASQTITVNSPATQSYMLSGWAKANSVPTDETRAFRLKAQIWYDESGTDTEEVFVDFNPYTDQWQYASGSIVPNAEKEMVYKIVVYCIYDHNCNTAYFDNLSLIRENAPVTYTRNEKGDITSITENGQTTEVEYSSVDLSENNGAEEIITVTTPTDETYYQKYDESGRVIEDRDNTLGITTNYSYDSFGNIITQVSKQDSDSNVIQTDNTYSSDGKFLVSSVDSNRSKLEYAYNTITGAVTSTSVYTNSSDDDSKITTNYQYSNADNTLTMYYIDSDKDGVFDNNEKQVNFTYDDNLLLTAMSSGNTTYNISYDSFRNITSISIYGRSVALAAYTYEANNGIVKAVTYANGNTVENVYDELDRVVAIKYNNIVVYTYTYDGSGRLFSACDVSGNRTYYYTYDLNGSIIGTREVYTSTGAEIIRTENTYDSYSRIASITYYYGGSSFTYTFGYDEESSMLTSVGLPTGTTLYYTYDSYNRLSSKEIKNGENVSVYKETYTYAVKDNKYITDYISSIQYGNTTVDTEYYTYDDVGNILTVKVGSELKLSYEYDDAFQLIRENNKYANKTYIYEYDRYGNITSKKTYSYTTGTLGTLTDTVNYTYGDESWGDLLTNYNGINITYDAAGNPQNWRNADDIEWLESAGKQMSLFFDSENGLYMYEYNMDNIRTKKTVYGEQGIDFLYESQYILNGTSIVRETRTYADGSVITLDFLYDDSGVILGVVYNGTAYYYRKNLQGDITGIVNSSGTVVVSYTYDAWGNPVSITGSMSSTLGEINPIRYRGYYYDTETGFYYLQSRYYDPVVGRFISPDSTDFLGATGTTLSLNLFAYCENNAVNGIDEYGYITTSYNKLKDQSWMFRVAKQFGMNFELKSFENKHSVKIFSIDLKLIKLKLSMSVGLTANYKAGMSFNYSKSSVGVSLNIGMGKNYSIAYSFNRSWKNISKSISLVWANSNYGVYISLNLEFRISHIATAGLIAACVYVPQFIPAVSNILVNSKNACIATITAFAGILRACYV